MGKRTVIIGGGAIGSATAYFLALASEPGDRTTVIERDPSYRLASSSLSASSIRQQFSTPVNVQLSQFGYAFMESCANEGGVGLAACGYLFVARNDQVAALKERVRTVRALGGVIEELDSSGLAERYPWLDCSGLEYASRGIRGEGWFDGYMLQQLYRRRAVAAGVEYLQGDAVGLAFAGTRIRCVELADGKSLPADQVVNAAGAWSAPIARFAGVDLPIRARRRTAFVVSCPTRLADFPILVDATGIFVRPEQQQFLCTVSPDPAFDPDDLPLSPDFSLFDAQIWPTLAERIPAFEALRVERAWAGYYDFNTLDHNGLVGQIGPDNFFVATGFSGHGLMHSAGVGRGMAELLTLGRYQTLDLSPLSPLRIESGHLLREDAIY